MSLTSVQSIDLQIQQLMARKRLVEARDGEVNQALTVLHKYADVLTAAQRRRMVQLAGDEAAPAPAKSGKRPHPNKGKVLGTQAPKYCLPTGETWSGRGHTPRTFAAWAASAEGRAWRKARPGESFPPISVAGKQTAGVPAASSAPASKKPSGKKLTGKKPAAQKAASK
ncbi:H-NS family nucleoid-associated regulatory protein [Stenotrophomonas sp. Sm3119]|uniref:H-NS family nucleoid-associated regulatory protein n=1 Tax=Stenotrophomonas sp. Sm3119 TaxID=3002744 RepID=UPI0027E45C4F|nr:H-NS family nucleoid-associated regulatory protein [Stenotrophomonas sp. Sm3119]MDQ7306490.1 H-NS family nucleoid-associated regulatory protein [Stenotrophomonas sp. Sm3119]